METIDNASTVPALNKTRSSSVPLKADSTYFAEVFGDDVYAVDEIRWRWRFCGPEGLQVASWLSYDNSYEAESAVKKLLGSITRVPIIEQGNPYQGLALLVYPDPLSEGCLWNLVNDRQVLASSERPHDSGLAAISYLEDLRPKLAEAECRLKEE